MAQMGARRAGVLLYSGESQVGTEEDHSVVFNVEDSGDTNVEGATAAGKLSTVSRVYLSWPRTVGAAALCFSTPLRRCPPTSPPNAVSRAIMAACSQITVRKLHFILEPTRCLRSRASLLPRARLYATQSSLGGSNGPSRKQITVTTDDGRVRWADLSTREKAARTTQQSINFIVVITGVVMTVGLPHPKLSAP